MGNFIDLKGQRFGRLLVQKFAYIENKKTFWLCRCDCGNKHLSRSDNLRTGTHSCGCLRRETVSAQKGKKRKATGSLQKFMRRVKKQRNGCWHWRGPIVATTGYGRFYVGLNKKRFAHRVAFEMFKGKIPGKLQVRHVCDVKHCVNPAHLLLGTSKDNAADAIERGLYPRGIKHPQAKLNLRQIKQIRQSHKPINALALQFKISRIHVSRIKARQVWTHV